MASALNPYISFRNNAARQAMEFYKDVFGGTLTLNTFGEYGDPNAPGRRRHHARSAGDRQRFHPDGRRHAARNGGQALATTSPSASAVTTSGSCAVTGTSCPKAARSRCHSRSRCGAMCSANAPINSASRGWSTSANLRADRPSPSAAGPFIPEALAAHCPMHAMLRSSDRLGFDNDHDHDVAPRRRSRSPWMIMVRRRPMFMISFRDPLPAEPGDRLLAHRGPVLGGWFCDHGSGRCTVGVYPTAASSTRRGRHSASG